MKVILKANRSELLPERDERLRRWCGGHISLQGLDVISYPIFTVTMGLTLTLGRRGSSTCFAPSPGIILGEDTFHRKTCSVSTSSS